MSKHTYATRNAHRGYGRRRFQARMQAVEQHFAQVEQHLAHQHLVAAIEKYRHASEGEDYDN